MNATQTAILEALATNPFTVTDLVDQLEKSETTIRKNLKELEAQQAVRKESTHWFITSASVVAEIAMDSDEAYRKAMDEYTELMNSTEADDAAATKLSEEELVAEADEFYGEAASTEEIAEMDQHVAETEAAQAEGTETPAPKKYQRHATPTTRTVRENQITKARVQVLKNGETAEDGVAYSVSSKWMTVCLTDKTVGQFDRVLDAHFASSYPTFCPTCASKMTDDQIGRRRAVKVQP